jgi:two-component system, OmpR family, alkaline phosphatase synthesis response regulator PhoP
VSIRVLAVDDEPDVLRLVEIKLRKAGFEVLTARDGEEGLQRAVGEAPDVVLMDAMMPKMDGFTAAAKIKERMEQPPLILMLTAKGQESDVVRGLAGGADDYIVKPFAPRELVARINLALIKAGKPAILTAEA